MLNIRGKSEVSGPSTLSRTTPGKPWFKITAVAVFRVVVVVDVKSMPALYFTLFDSTDADATSSVAEILNLT